MTHKIFARMLMVAALALVPASLSLAQSSETAPPKVDAGVDALPEVTTPTVTSAPAVSPTAKASEVLNIQSSEGQMIRLSQPVSTIFVANPDIADVTVKSSQLIYIYGKKIGETTVFAVDSKDNIVASRRVVVGLNLGRLRAALAQLAGSKIRANSVDDVIILSGSVETAGEALDAVQLASRYLPQTGNSANQIINRITVNGPNQVNLRVRIAEVSRDAVKTLGVSNNVGDNLFGDSGFSIGFNSGINFPDGAFGVSSLVNSSIGLQLDALVTEGLATVLAEPNLTALSGESANFLAGGEFPIFVPDSDGAINVEYREVGVSLAFTPTIVNGDRISLRVRPEVSDLDRSTGITLQGTTIPGITTRRADTTVELGSGQSFAIAGLIKNESAQNISKFPGLAELPILGTLFRSEQFSHGQSEVVIVVTPYLVRPTSAANIQVPTDGFVPPNDVDRWLNGRQNSEVPTPQPVTTATPGESAGSAGLVGNVGFQLQ